MGDASFGKYKLIAELGHGGMADVFLAVQAGPAGSGFRKLTVIKRLRQNLAEEPEFVAMLVDEARIAARLNHPNVVQTNEVGEYNNQYFIAMEYLDGQPLHRIQYRSQRTKNGEPQLFDKEMQYVVVMDTLAGLHHAHELLDYDGTPLQIVHRDMTPHNIFVTYEGQVKVVDFGIAKAAGRASETRQGIVKGKVRYMAPEHAVGQNVDRRADIFCVGVILWEIATGRRMWKDMDDLQIVQALVRGEIPRSPRSIDPTVPEQIDAICVKALAQRPEDRYATAEEFRADLEQFLADSGILVAARRKIPKALNDMFNDKRQAIRTVVEQQLAQLEARYPDFSAVPLAGDSHSHSHSNSLIQSQTSIPRAEVAATDQMLTGGTKDSQVIPMADVREPRKSRSMLTVIAVAVIVAIGVGGVFGVRRVRATQVAPVTETVTVRITGSPSNARVRIDDQRPVSLPYDMTVPKDNKDHRIVIEADGYKSQEETVSFSHDILLSVDLPKAEEKPVPSASQTSTVAHKTTPPPPQWNPGQIHHTATTTTTAKDPTPPPTKDPTPPPPTTPATTTPPPPTTPATTAPPPPTAPPVDVAAEHRKAVNRAVAAHRGEVAACFERARVNNPQIAGVITIGGVLTPSGSVSSANIVNSTAQSPLLENCLLQHFRSWPFPAPPPGASDHISYTFRFE
jgi:serine/threonine-protein kinase